MDDKSRLQQQSGFVFWRLLQALWLVRESPQYRRR